MLFIILSIPTIITLFVLLLTTFYGKMFKETRSWWRWQILLAYDQLINTFFLGWADESISSRTYRRSLKKSCVSCKFVLKLIDSIFFWTPNHCKQAYESEKNRSQLPPELR